MSPIRACRRSCESPFFSTAGGGFKFALHHRREVVVVYSRDVRLAAVGLVRSGLSASEASRRTGVGHATVEWWCRLDGVRLRPGRMGGPVRRPVTQAAPLPPRGCPGRGSTPSAGR